MGLAGCGTGLEKQKGTENIRVDRFEPGFIKVLFWVDGWIEVLGHDSYGKCIFTVCHSPKMLH